MPLSNAELQSRYRQRRAQGVPVIRLVERKGRALSRPAQWAAAVGRLRHLQAEYEAWLEQLPEPLHDTATGKRLAQVCALDPSPRSSPPAASSASRPRSSPRQSTTASSTATTSPPTSFRAGLAEGGDCEPRNPARPLDGRHRHHHRGADRRHPAFRRKLKRTRPYGRYRVTGSGVPDARDRARGRRRRAVDSDSRHNQDNRCSLVDTWARTPRSDHHPVEPARMPCTGRSGPDGPRHGPGQRIAAYRTAWRNCASSPIPGAWRTTTSGFGRGGSSRCGRGCSNPGTRRRRRPAACGLTLRIGWFWRARRARRRCRRGGDRRPGAGLRATSPPRSGSRREMYARRSTRRGRRIASDGRRSIRVGSPARRRRHNSPGRPAFRGRIARCSTRMPSPGR